MGGPYTAERVAVLSDVHGNVVALDAVLREVVSMNVDLFVVGGDLTWGSRPEETRALVAPFERISIFVRGNAERFLLEQASAGGDESELTPRERWMLERHTSETKAFLSTFVEGAVVEIAGLGPVRFCHGSPRSDEELITPETPEARMRGLTDGIAEQVLVSAHTHLQFDRTVARIRSVNPGSIGMPYEGTAGTASWAVLGPDVQLRRTTYDVDEAVRSYRSTDDPLAEQMAQLLVNPPTRDEAIADAEAKEFSG